MRVRFPSSAPVHPPVMLSEMLQCLAPKDGGVYVDATFGGGGYSLAILNSAECRVYALDKDPDAQKRALEFAKCCPQDSFTFIANCFSNLAEVITEPVDGIVFDFGLSHFQLKDGSRGFSFQNDGPLDMRMNQSGLTAAQILNTFSEAELSKIIRNYGQEPRANQVARAIVKNRPFSTTKQLADLLKTVVPMQPGFHSATLTFQGLRIFINNELQAISNALQACPFLLKKSGRLVAVSFHALEDKIVKNFLNPPGVSRYLPPCEVNSSLKVLTKKPLVPSPAEIQKNPSARSAKLRAAEK